MYLTNRKDCKTVAWHYWILNCVLGKTLESKLLTSMVVFVLLLEFLVFFFVVVAFRYLLLLLFGSFWFKSNSTSVYSRRLDLIVFIFVFTLSFLCTTNRFCAINDIFTNCVQFSKNKNRQRMNEINVKYHKEKKNVYGCSSSTHILILKKEI